MQGDGKRAWLLLLIGWLGLVGVALFTRSGVAFTLADGAADRVWLLTQSGGFPWVTVLLVAALGLLALDGSRMRGQRLQDMAQLLVLLLVFLPLFALFNEHVLKDRLRVARPSHRALAQAGYLPSPERFYHLDGPSRRRLLAGWEDPSQLADMAATLGVSPRVAKTWVHEVSSSFPSGHAWNAFLAAGVFTLLAGGSSSRLRWGLAVVLSSWAVAVSWSRVVLGVHRPVDVVVGAACGVVSGALVWLLWQRWRRWRGWRGAA